MSALPTSRWGRLLLEVRLFVDHALVLWVPGSRLTTVDAHPGGGGAPTGWSAAEIQLLIDEGRRQLDRQRADLDHIRARAQFLFTTAVALLVVLAAGAHTVRADGSGALSVAWAAGMLFVGAGLLAAAGIISGRADLGIIDAAALSSVSPPVDEALAGAYAEIVAVGENTVAARLTVLRDAVLAVLLGSLVEAVIWYVTILQH